MELLINLLPLLKLLASIAGPALLYAAGNAKGRDHAELKADRWTLDQVRQAGADRYRLRTDPAFARDVRDRFTAR